MKGSINLRGQSRPTPRPSMPSPGPGSSRPAPSPGPGTSNPAPSPNPPSRPFRARRFILCAGFLFAIAFPAFAQPDPADPSTTPTEWYTSIAGVVGATVLLVSGAKRVFGNMPFMATIPTWLYAVVIALGLTYVASQVLGTLPGVFWQLAWQSAQNAAIATGVYEWFNNGTKPLWQSAQAAGVQVTPPHERT
jgi:hypothetical protein